MRMRKSFHKVCWILAVQIIKQSTFGLTLVGHTLWSWCMTGIPSVARLILIRFRLNIIPE